VIEEIHWQRSVIKSRSRDAYDSDEDGRIYENIEAKPALPSPYSRTVFLVLISIQVGDRLLKVDLLQRLGKGLIERSSPLSPTNPKVC
jgi:hypothetical protein